MSRKKHAEAHENHERWLVSYADFITLLFAFFVVMYAMSSVNEGKFRVLSESMMAAFRSVDPHSVKPIMVDQMVGSSATKASGTPSASQRNFAPDFRPMPTLAIQRAPRAMITIARGDSPNEKKSVTSTESSTDPNLTKVVAKLQAYLSELIKADMVNLRNNTLWVEIEIKNNVLFESGSAVLNKEAIEPLAQISEVLREIPNRIQVEGFTDNKPISSPIYPSNWELSAARAASVVNLMMKNGVLPERMSAVGYGQFQPITDNATDQGRMQNRRVVIVIIGNTDTRYPIKSQEVGAKPSAQNILTSSSLLAAAR